MAQAHYSFSERVHRVRDMVVLLPRMLLPQRDRGRLLLPPLWPAELTILVCSVLWWAGGSPRAAAVFPFLAILCLLASACVGTATSDLWTPFATRFPRLSRVLITVVPASVGLLLFFLLRSLG